MMKELIQSKEEEEQPKKKMKVDDENTKRPKSHIFIGTKSGLIKSLHLKGNKEILDDVHVPIKKCSQLSSLSFVDPKYQTKIILGFENQFVQTYYVNEQIFDAPVSYVHDDSLLINAFYIDEVLVTGLDSGKVVLYEGKKNKHVINTVSFTPKGDWDVANKRLSFVKCNQFNGKDIITGGCENNLKIWDLNASKFTFTAKNVPKDYLHLRVPIDIADATYLNESTIAVCTRQQQLRLYDTRKGPKPFCNFNFGNSPLTKIVSNPCKENVAFVGESYGKISYVDFRINKTSEPTKGQCMKQYRGAVGAIKDIVVHDKLPLLFSVSLDQKMHIHNIHTRNLVHYYYSKSMPKCLLLSKNLSEEFKSWDIYNDKHKFRK